jgi:GT2 family glycosyltransferase
MLNWMYWKQTIQSLQYLLDNGIKNTAVVIVDNGSTNNSAEEIKSFLQKNSESQSHNEFHFKSVVVNLIESASNEGFSGGVNRGVSAAQKYSPEFYLLLNNDAYIKESDIEALKICSKENDYALVGPVIHSHDNSSVITFAGKRWPGLLFDQRFTPPQTKTWTTGYIEGSALLFHASFLKKKLSTDGFLMDERFFLYYEDVDLCRRALEMGFQCLMTSTATATHKVSFSTGGHANNRSRYYMNRNRVLIAKKWMHQPSRSLFYSAFISSRVLLILKSLLSKETRSSVRYMISALCDGFSNRFGYKDFQAWH